MGNIEWNAAVVGTNTTNVSSGFTGMRQNSQTGFNLFIYGEIPAYEDTELAAAAAAAEAEAEETLAAEKACAVVVVERNEPPPCSSG